MEGARWDIMQGVIMESKLKELFPQMPVINVRVSKYFDKLKVMLGVLCLNYITRQTTINNYAFFSSLR